MRSVPCLDPNPRPLDSPPPAVVGELGWWIWGGKGFGETVMFRCHDGHDMQLPHEIAEDGTATPSVLAQIKCAFHDNIQLDGWTRGHLPRRADDAGKVQRMRELGYSS